MRCKTVEHKSLNCLYALVAFFLLDSNLALSAQEFAPSYSGWRFDGDAELVEDFAGRPAIKIFRGKAFLDEIDFENGTIEFDIYTSGERAFVYVLFRGASAREFEEFYLRPHKSELPDALQYAPVFQNRSAWQLYHGKTGTSAVKMPANEWIPVRIELAGNNAKVWVGDVTEPAMVIENLGRKPNGGWMAFRGFVPATSPAKYAAYFSGLKISPLETAVNARTEVPKLPVGQITQWSVSPAFEAEPGPVLSIPQEIAKLAWSIPPMQSTGVFEFLRSRAIPNGVRHWAVAADVTLVAEKAQTCAMHLGFSDDLTLSVNGKHVLYQEANYRFELPRQDGVMHPDQVVAYLHLNKGDNRIRAVVADSFGGWGLSARTQDCQGVTSR